MTQFFFSHKLEISHCDAPALSLQCKQVQGYTGFWVLSYPKAASSHGHIVTSHLNTMMRLSVLLCCILGANFFLLNYKTLVMPLTVCCYAEFLGNVLGGEAGTLLKQWGSLLCLSRSCNEGWSRLVFVWC